MSVLTAVQVSASRKATARREFQMADVLHFEIEVSLAIGMHLRFLYILSHISCPKSAEPASMPRLSEKR